MSLLNKALKDIEQRDGEHELALEPTVQLPQTRPWRNVITIVAVLVSAMIVIALAYLLIPQAPEESEATHSAPEAKGLVTKPLEKQPITLKQSVASQVIQPQLNEADDEAELRRQSNRETRVTNESTYNGNKNVKQRVSPSQDSSLSQSRQLPDTKEPVAEISQDKMLESAPKPIIKQPRTSKTEPPASAANATRPVTSSSDSVVKVVKALSVQQRAQRWFEQGQQSLRFAMTNEAIKQFEQAVILVPEHEQARSSLAATLYGQQRLEEAYSVLINGLKVAPETLSWRVMIAKMAIEQQQYQRVLEVLGDGQDARATQLGNNDYWILKGSAARQLKQHDIAKVCFTELVRRQPNVAKWWLALATSEDALGQYHSARGHYATALQLGGLSGPSQQYARARYDSLQDTP